MYPSAARAAVRQGAAALVSLANDAWFADDLVLRAHFAVNTVRAVETGRAVAPIRKPHCLVANVDFRAFRSDRTFYATAGDWLPLACATTLLAALVFGVAARSRQRISVSLPPVARRPPG